MAYYKTDLNDIFFNLFDVLKVQENAQGLGEDDIKGIIYEFDKFVENEIFPTREESDHVGVKLENGKVTCAPILKSCHDNYHANGWFAIGFPEEVGGTPVPEALSATCVSISTGANAAWMMYPGLTRSALNVIRMKGLDLYREVVCQKMITGEWGGTMCLTEPGAGSDVGALKTTATPNADGSFNIKGVKIFISSGDNDLYQNMVHLVLARTPGGSEGTKGISLFMVPKFHFDATGNLGDRNDVVCTKIEEKMGIHASATCELTFGQNSDCKGWLIGQEFEGMANMFIMMNEARLYVGVQGEAQGNLAYMMAEKYAKERSQFGQTLVDMPDVKRMLLRMRAKARGMRAIITYTASLFDKEHTDKDAQALIGLLTPICKAYCSDEGFNIASEAVQVHGGYGFCTEYGVEQFIRDTKIAQIYEGTNGIQAVDFVMRKILKDGGKTLQKLTGDMLAFVNGLDGDNWSKQKSLFMKVMGSAQPIIESFSRKAKEGKMDQILQHCTDFLTFASQVVVAWRLGVAATIAEEKLANASGDEKAFLESKIVDFKVYCQHFLSHNLSIAKTITELEEDLAQVVI